MLLPNIKLKDPIEDDDLCKEELKLVQKYLDDDPNLSQDKAVNRAQEEYQQNLEALRDSDERI